MVLNTSNRLELSLTPAPPAWTVICPDSPAHGRRVWPLFP